MKVTYSILVDEPEPGGVCEQIAFLVDETHGKVVNITNDQTYGSFTVVTAEWPESQIIDADLRYGFVHPMMLVTKLYGVVSWKPVRTLDTTHS